MRGVTTTSFAISIYDYFVVVLLIVIMIFTIAAKLCKKAVTVSNFDFFKRYLRSILGWL